MDQNIQNKIPVNLGDLSLEKKQIFTSERIQDISSIMKQEQSFNISDSNILTQSHHAKIAQIPKYIYQSQQIPEESIHVLDEVSIDVKNQQNFNQNMNKLNEQCITQKQNNISDNQNNYNVPSMLTTFQGGIQPNIYQQQALNIQFQQGYETQNKPVQNISNSSESSIKSQFEYKDQSLKGIYSHNLGSSNQPTNLSAKQDSISSIQQQNYLNNYSQPIKKMNEQNQNKEDSIESSIQSQPRAQDYKKDYQYDQQTSNYISPNIQYKLDMQSQVYQQQPQTNLYLQPNQYQNNQNNQFQNQEQNQIQEVSIESSIQSQPRTYYNNKKDGQYDQQKINVISSNNSYKQDNQFKVQQQQPQTNLLPQHNEYQNNQNFIQYYQSSNYYQLNSKNSQPNNFDQRQQDQDKNYQQMITEQILQNNNQAIQNLAQDQSMSQGNENQNDISQIFDRKTQYNNNDLIYQQQTNPYLQNIEDMKTKQSQLTKPSNNIANDFQYQNINQNMNKNLKEGGFTPNNLKQFMEQIFQQQNSQIQNTNLNPTKIKDQQRQEFENNPLSKELNNSSSIKSLISQNNKQQNLQQDKSQENGLQNNDKAQYTETPTNLPILNQVQEETQIQFSDEEEGEEESQLFPDEKEQVLNMIKNQLNESVSSIIEAKVDNNDSFILQYKELFFSENKKQSSLLSESKSLKEFGKKIIQQKQLKKQFVEIEPRDYQEEIFKNVTQNFGNYIVYLETGTGKTLVSQMIAQYTLSVFKNSKVAFLANQVNLVEQQYNNFLTYQRSIEEYLVKQNIQKEINLNINISFFHGKMNLDFWNRSFWQKNVEQSQIIFFSSQVFLNGLRRGHFNLSQFKLIIFDECHNASKEHAFSQIMKEFYFPAKENNIVQNNIPNVIGLSATPITQGNKGIFNVRKEMIKLASNLDCKFVNYDLRKVDAQLRNIEQTQRLYDVDLYENQYQYIESNNIKGFENAYEVLQNLYCQYPELKLLYNQLQDMSRQDNYFSKIFTQLLRKIINILEEYVIILIYQIGVYVVQYLIYDILQELKGVNITTPKTINMKKQLEDILEQFYQLFKSKYNDINTHTSNKAHTLLSVLQNSEGISLIFCNSKIVVKYVTKFIQSIFSDKINPNQSICEYIMGQSGQNKKDQSENELKIMNGSNNFEIQQLKQQSIQEAQKIISQDTQFNLKFFELKQKYSEQQKIVERFRNKQFQILVSTSVVEEGFDIPSCNLVIAFSKIISQRQFIQMKGRARAENSKFYALVAVCKNKISKNQDQHQKMTDLIKEEYLTLSKMTRDTFEAEKSFQLSYDEEDKSMDNYENFIIKETNANVNTFWVKEIVNQFCQSFCYNNQLQNKFPIIFDSLMQIFQNAASAEGSKYLSLVVLPFQLQANIFLNSHKLKNKKEDAQRCAFMQAVKSLLNYKYISKELRPRHKSYKNFYFGRGEDDYYVEYSDKYFSIIQKYMQEVFVGYLNGKKKQIVVYKKLYTQIVDKVFVQNQKTLEDEELFFYAYEVIFKSQQLHIQVIYDKKYLEDFDHSDIKFVYQKQIVKFFILKTSFHSYIFKQKLDKPKLEEIRIMNQQAHLKILNLEKQNLQPKKIYSSKGLIYKKTQVKDYENTEESILINENVVFLYVFSEQNLNQIQKINSYIDSIRDFLKLKIISEKIFSRVQEERNELQNVQIERWNIYVKPNFYLTGYFSGRSIKADEKIIYPVIFENISTLNEKEIIHIFQKNYFEKNIVFLGKQYFRFITSINVFNENFKTHYDLLSSELDMKFNDCFVMSKAVESKLFKYLMAKNYVTLAPCLTIISQKLHTFVADQITLQEKVLVKSHQQNPLNYNMAEIRNKQLAEIIYYFIGFLIIKNPLIFQNFEKYITEFQFALKSFDLIERYCVLTKFINLEQEETQAYFNPKKEQYVNNLITFSQAQINYTFKNIGLLQQVFTHSSYKQSMICPDINLIKKDIQTIESRQSKIQLCDVSNDSLSFLGSIIFSQIVLRQIYPKYQATNPNELDIFMEIICSEQTKSWLSAKLKLDSGFLYGAQYKNIFLRLNYTADQLRQQHLNQGVYLYNNDINILSQLFDALVGAIYIDLNQDFGKTEEFFKYEIHKIVDDISQIAEQYTKYSLIKALKKKGYNWDDMQIIKLPHPEQYLPQNQNKYLYQIYDIKNENLLIDKIFECQRIEEAYKLIKESLILTNLSNKSQ